MVHTLRRSQMSSTPSAHRPALLLALAVAILAAALPLTADAAVVEVRNNEVVYDAAAGESNDVYVDEILECPDGSTCERYMSIQESGAGVTVQTGTGCHTY